MSVRPRGMPVGEPASTGTSAMVGACIMNAEMPMRPAPPGGGDEQHRQPAGELREPAQAVGEQDTAQACVPRESGDRHPAGNPHVSASPRGPPELSATLEADARPLLTREAPPVGPRLRDPRPARRSASGPPHLGMSPWSSEPRPMQGYFWSPTGRWAWSSRASSRASGGPRAAPGPWFVEAVLRAIARIPTASRRVRAEAFVSAVTCSLVLTGAPRAWRPPARAWRAGRWASSSARR